MTQVFVHGVVSVSAAPQLSSMTTGEGEAEVRTVRHGTIAALVRDRAPGRASASRELRNHWSLLEQVTRDTTVVPVRFGTVMESDDQVREGFLAPNADRLTGLLDELAGKVQVTVKCRYDEERLLREIIASSPPIAQLRDRVRGVPEAAAYYDRIRLGELIAAEVERRRRSDAQFVIGRLQTQAVAVKEESPTGQNMAAHAAFLVERARLDRFERCLRELVDEVGDRLTLRSVGPLPAYSFTEAGEVAAWA